MVTSKVSVILATPRQLPGILDKAPQITSENGLSFSYLRPGPMKREWQRVFLAVAACVCVCVCACTLPSTSPNHKALFHAEGCLPGLQRGGQHHALCCRCRGLSHGPVAACANRICNINHAVWHLAFVT